MIVHIVSIMVMNDDSYYSLYNYKITVTILNYLKFQDYVIISWN